MKRVGINRAFIGHIGLDDIPSEKWGKVKIFSTEWWDVLHTALKTASELDIDIGMFNGPGWSQSGGPWVQENEAMRYLYAVDTLIKGGRHFNGPIGTPPENFQRQHVLAFRAPKDFHKTLANANPKVQSTLKDQDLSCLVDKNYVDAIRIPSGTESRITFTMDESFTARTLKLHPANSRMAFDARLEVDRDGKFETVKSFRVDRSNPAENVGFDLYAPVTVSFEATAGKTFRLIVDQVWGNAGLTEIELMTTPAVERFEEKVFAKMHPTPLPFWHHYMWDRQPESNDAGHYVDPSEVKSLTSLMSADGRLNWDVPSGEWIILQTGMLPTGTFNAPASEGGRGLEIDKMSQRHVASHFDNFLGQILERIPAGDRKSFKVVVQDSYETGGQNWTDDFEDKFKQAFGYDPKPYLPAYYGFVVGNQETSDRFLWDMRRFVADQVAYEFVGGFRKISNQHGLTTWLENYGHWGFPAEFLQYGGQSDEVAGEFWSEGELGDIENRAASSAAHIYGKNKVSAESFTSAANQFARYPALFKERGDRFFAEGINNTLLHVYIHQPDDRLPGVNAWFGNDFNRSNTWFYEMDGFLDYLKRCNFMLQQGLYVADVAYFIGEDAPKMTGVQDPELPRGYDFDYVNAEVILNRMTIKNGRFTLPDGLSYKILVLPQLETMRPELLQKLELLVKAGGVLLGPKPLRSPSLRNHKEADRQVKMLGDKLWGSSAGQGVNKNTYGAGMVLTGWSLKDALDLVDVKPDLALSPEDNVHYIHRELEGGDLYFLTNQSGREIYIDPAFRISGKQPELWNAMNGAVRHLPEFADDGRTTRIPLHLPAQGSTFIVFRKDASAGDAPRGPAGNFDQPVETLPVEGTWKVTFTKPDSTTFSETFDTLQDWSKHPDTAIRYFSGSALYEISIPEIPLANHKRIVLNLGDVGMLAKVTVNGKMAGPLWIAPYEIDITDLCEPGKNTIGVKVTNTWVNSLIGEQRLSPNERRLWTIVNPYRADSPLQSSGLIGPVQMRIYEDQK